MSRCHPFQKLCYISRSDGRDLLLAATGPYILSLDLRNGGVVSKWPDENPQAVPQQTNKGSRNGKPVGRSTDDDPPTKRRKLSPAEEEEQNSRESSVSIEFVSERVKGQRRQKKKLLRSALPNVTHVMSTTSGGHVIAVTAEDKCIRVFDLDSGGGLKLLSERQGSQLSSDMYHAYRCVDVCQKGFVR
jgi:tRNA (guanine-N(7)-)-methyltransferase subunit TRM82